MVVFLFLFKKHMNVFFNPAGPPSCGGRPRRRRPPRSSSPARRPRPRPHQHCLPRLSSPLVRRPGGHGLAGAASRGRVAPAGSSGPRSHVELPHGTGSPAGTVARRGPASGRAPPTREGLWPWLAQSFGGAPRGSICVRVFIGVSVRACCKCLRCNV
jgi:hypothetical protein